MRMPSEWVHSLPPRTSMAHTTVRYLPAALRAKLAVRPSCGAVCGPTLTSGWAVRLQPVALEPSGCSKCAVYDSMGAQPDEKPVHHTGRVREDV